MNNSMSDGFQQHHWQDHDGFPWFSHGFLLVEASIGWFISLRQPGVYRNLGEPKHGPRLHHDQLGAGNFTMWEWEDHV